jgi:hypothetical protein
MEASKDTEKQESNSKLKIFNFNESYVAPVYKFERKGDYHFLTYGSDNSFPNLILDSYNSYGSPLHRAIVNKKTKMIAGFGYQPLLDPKMNEWANRNNLERLLIYLGKDMVLFGGFAVEIIWSRDGNSFEMKWLPIHTLRIGLKENEDEPDYYWYSRDWGQWKKEGYEPEYIKRFDPNDRKGRQALYYIDANPAGTDLYPLPSYVCAMNFIQLDYQIGKFHLNQVMQGFSAGFLLSFNTGVPSIDEQNQTYREIQKNYRGTNGSGSIIITYADSKDQAPTLEPINLNTTDERFILLQETVEKNITQAHECPIALVSSVSGKLGSQDERKELMAEFQVYYCAAVQNQLEEALNGVLETIGYTEKIKLNDYTTADTSGVLTEGEQPLQIADSRVDRGNTYINGII